MRRKQDRSTRLRRFSADKPRLPCYTVRPGIPLHLQPDCPAAHPTPKVPPAPMLTPFSSEDLSRIFDSRALTRGRSLVLLEAVDVSLADDSINVAVEHLGRTSVRYHLGVFKAGACAAAAQLRRCLLTLRTAASIKQLSKAPTWRSANRSAARHP